MRNGIGDQGARVVLFRGTDRTRQVQDDAVSASVGAGPDKFIDVDRNKQQRAPNRQIFAHGGLSSEVAMTCGAAVIVRRETAGSRAGPVHNSRTDHRPSWSVTDLAIPEVSAGQVIGLIVSFVCLSAPRA